MSRQGRRITIADSDWEERSKLYRTERSFSEVKHYIDSFIKVFAHIKTLNLIKIDLARNLKNISVSLSVPCNK